jgi:NAD(P)-dependent dehydrogenase (short-subunit alcohol dehydrogenase family)
MEKEFEGKAAIVTGAGSGIGRATAQLFARMGANVTVADVNDDGCNETVKMIKDEGGDAIAVHCDVADPASVKAMVESTVKQFGRLDYACNNAGIAGESHPTAEYPEDAWRRVIDVNLVGVFYCMKYEIPEMLKVGGGAIVNMSSILGVVGFANASAYASAKHGMLGLTKASAIEYAPQKVRVNAVCPAFIKTPMLEQAGITEGTEMGDALIAMHPIKRMGTPEEIAEAVVWLCSDKSSFVTGDHLLVDGGFTAQ